MNKENKTSFNSRKMGSDEFISLLSILKDGVASCGFILEEKSYLIKESQRFDLQADLNDLSFVRADYELDLFLKYGASLADDNFFLIIHNIDLIDQARQVNWFGLAKNRSIRSLDDMLEDIIVIFTISSIENVNKIEYNFWNFGHNFIY